MNTVMLFMSSLSYIYAIVVFFLKASSFIAIDVSYAIIDTPLNMKNCLSNLILFEEMQILL